MGDSCCAAGSMGAIKQLIEEELGARCALRAACNCVPACADAESGWS